MKIIRYFLLILFAASMFYIAGCTSPKVVHGTDSNLTSPEDTSPTCPLGGGAKYVYIDTNDLTIAIPNNYLGNDTIIEFLENISVAKADWFSGNCKTTSHYYLYINGTYENATKQGFDNYIQGYNSTCNGCIMEYMVDSKI